MSKTQAKSSTAAKAAAAGKKADVKKTASAAPAKPKRPAMPKLKVLLCASEAQPYIASGGLADVAGALPGALRANKVDCRVVLPLYKDITPELRKTLTFVTSFEVSLGWRKQYCGILTAEHGGVTYYFIDNEYYFGRDGLYGYMDDGERFAYFSKAVIEMIRHIGFVPDVLHANDWQTALAPVYLNLQYREFDECKAIKTLFTIHNIQYQGIYDKAILGDVFGLEAKDERILEYDGCLNLMKAAIEMSDRVNTVSPTYAQEIMDPWFSHGLDGFLQARAFKLSGILNGLDTNRFDPAADPMIFERYTIDSIEKKAVNKARLLEALSMQEQENTPLVAIITRLAAHKGMDLVRYVFEDMLRMGTQLVILGSGEYQYEQFFFSMQDKYPQSVRFIAGFIPDLAQKIYAGADIFLMPSKSEPCGLAQMIAARYATIPVVRETGGLRDTIRDFGEKDGNGFTFKTYNAHDMLGAVERARGCYLDKDAWLTVQKAAMSSDFTWKKSAKEYEMLYRGM
ncbi:MAG: glycogen synthase GlgA [Acetanaerobacterium sp.]